MYSQCPTLSAVSTAWNCWKIAAKAAVFKHNGTNSIRCDSTLTVMLHVTCVIFTVGDLSFSLHRNQALKYYYT